MATIQGIYIALFGRPADPLGLAFWNSQTNNGTDLTKLIYGDPSIGLGPLVGEPEYTDRFEGKTNAEIVNSIYVSLFGHDADILGLTFYVNQLASGQATIADIAIDIYNGAQGTDLEILQNKEAAANLFTAEIDTTAEILAYNENTIGIAQAYLAGVTADDATIPTEAEAEETIQLMVETPQGGAGQTFTLTKEADNIVGTAGNDTINGLVEDDDDDTSPNTFAPGDTIDGGAGIDTLRITQLYDGYNFGDGFGAGATVENVEILKIVQAYSTDAAFDLSGFTGLQQIVVDMTYDTSYSFYNLQEELVSVTLEATRADDTGRDGTFYLYEISNSIYTGDDDTLTINVINAGSESENSDFTFSHSNLAGDDVFENYKVVVGGDDNYLYIDNDNGTDDAEVVTVTVTNATGESGSIFLELDEQDTLETLDASAMTGDFRTEFDSTTEGQAVTVTTGSGDDDVELYDGEFTVNVGAGDDHVILASFGGNGDDTDDVLDGGEGHDKLSMDADAVANLLVMDVDNFEVLGLNDGSAGAVIVDADDLGFEEVDVEANIGSALTVEDFNGGTLTISASQSASITVESNTPADTLDIIIENSSAVSLQGGLDLTDIETVSFSSANATSDLVIDTAVGLNVTGVDTVSFSGAGDVDIDWATTGANDVDSVDLSGLTGQFDNDGFVFFGASTDIIVGNIGDNSILELSGASRNVIEFGAELDNDITIDAFDFGATITDDALDLSAFGIDDVGDLSFVDGGGNVTITSAAFDGSITLTGVLSTDLTANNFVFA